jgi:methionyl-tRNA synthetase
MQKRKYITTTLPYANSKPHIGHELEFVIGDALARYFKWNGYEVFFNIGLDEHGLKIQEAAKKSGITPKEYVDDLFGVWWDFTEKLQVFSWDSFYRTSNPEHIRQVQEFWEECLLDGDIYKKKYKGTYCIGCESFKTDRELEDKIVGGIDPALENPDVNIHKYKICPDHPTTTLQEVEEENYFFKLSKYRNKLSNWAYKAVDFIEPKSKRAEFLKFIDNIQDISISRDSSKVTWGVPVPGDNSQTIYVWFDALLNYIFAAGAITSCPDGNPDHSIFDRIWNDSDVIQICGPDNLKFQAVIFQGLLASGEFKHTDKLLVHGTITDAQGRKMGKSTGNVIDPIDQLEKYGVNAVRYYTLAGINTYGNSSWDENRLVELYNSNLGDDFGNLVTRVCVLARKVLDKFVDDPNVELDYSYVEDDKWCVTFDQEIQRIHGLWEQYLISDALFETNKLVKSLNKRIGDEEPWKDLEKGWPTILELHYALDKINKLYYPVIPQKAGEVRTALKECKKAIIFPKIEIKKEETC